MIRAFAFLVLIPGCRQVTAPRQDDAAVIETRWVLVQRPYDRLGELAQAGEAKVAPDTTTLVLERVSERLAPCPHHVIITTAQRDPLPVGELVTVDVRVEGCRHERQVLKIAPTRPDVEIETPTTVELGPCERTRVRFTARSEGRAGIAVRVVACFDSR